MPLAAEWVFVPICLLPLALAALVFGLRGRKLDDHPFCRRCGFDLFSRVAGPVAPVGNARRVRSRWAAACPECGADLGRRRAVGAGHRRRRRGLVLASLPLLLLCFSWFAAAGWYAAQTSDWQAYKPAWWLAAETGSRDAGRRDAAIGELADRMGRGKLTRSRIDDLTRRALEYQADQGRPWAPAWGEWVERAHEAGWLTEEQWRQYAGGAVCFRLEVRPTVRRGDPFVLRLSVAPGRVAGGRRFSLDAGFAGDVWLNGQHLPADRAMERIVLPGGVCADPGGPAGVGTASRLLCYELKPSLLAQWPDGVQTCRVSFDVLVGERPDGVDPPLGEAHVSLESPWRLLPRRQPSVRMLRGAPAASVGRLAVSADCRWTDDTRERVAVHVFCQDLPVALACDVLIRAGGAGGHEWPAGTLAWAKGSTGASATVETDSLAAALAGAEKVDVLLRPGAAVAARTVDLTEVWGEPIVIPDVEVVGGSAPPAPQ